MRWDVVVVGGGPAGWTAASNLAQVGLRTLLIAPDPYAPWPNNYGAWGDEVEAWPNIARRVWPRAEVRLDEERVHVLERAYVSIDNRKLQARLRADGEGAGLEVRAASVTGAGHDTPDSTLTLDSGAPVVAKLVIDATGHRPRLVRTGRGRAGGAQVAYGVRARLLEGHVDPDRMVLMDFSASHLAGLPREPPTFLYAMPLGEDVFVEETSLVGRPPVDVDLCRHRLELRLEARGWRLGPAKEIEHCFIPMGGPEPPKQQRVVAFGGAAAVVHPATGYMLANVLRAGPRLAEAVFEVRDQRDAVRWSQAAWQAVWPEDRRRAWTLYRYGMEVLINMDLSSTAAFFDTFFEIRPDQWKGYLSGDVTSAEVASAMWSVFARGSARLRWQLMSKGFYALMPTPFA